MFSKVLLISLVPAILGGCVHWPNKSRDGCEPLIKTSLGSLSVAGIEIPTGTPIPVKIGNATYTPQQIQRLTDSAQQMEQYRLGQCSVLSTLENLKPQPVEKIADIASKIAQLNMDLQRLFHELPKATESEKQVQSTEKKVTEALKEQKNLQAPLPSGADDKLEKSEQPNSSLFQQLTKLTAMVQELTNITARLRVEQRSHPSASRELQPSEVVVVGFSSGSHEMSTRMKANLLADLSSRLSETPQGKSMLIDVLGYSDTIGQNDKNAVLALRRAQAVASFLTEQQAIPRARLRSVSSAGAVEIPPFGRKVRILLNPTFVES